MDWLLVAKLVASVGLDAAEAIYNKWSTGQLPTAQDFTDLRAMQKITPEDLVLKAAALAGLTPEHPKIQELLALVKNPGQLPALPTFAPLPPTP